MEKNLGCYIDENDEFRSDVEKMSKWYNKAMETLDKMPVSNEEIPFLLFLMGAEAGLRCQNTTLH
tara:strand:+ start:121 stop:315 length:195 start_codon:yes stop_codon:yes gene_type:complete